MSTDTTPSLEAEREAFEAWYRKTQGDRAMLWDQAYGDLTPETMKGKYILKEEQSAWAAWQAARRALAQEAEDAARYRYLRSRMEFQSQKGSNPTMGLAVRLVAQHHDPHADWMEPRFSASVDRAIDAARARQEGGA